MSLTAAMLLPDRTWRRAGRDLPLDWRMVRRFDHKWKDCRMIGALLTGLVAGVVARMLTPGDIFRKMSGPKSWGVSLLIGLGGAALGYLIFTAGLGIGDTDVFDFGGIIGAVIGAIILLLIVGFFARRGQGSHPAAPPST
jgi:uncharacterized membrane protein YeaQ/YmgE (transglycosylase-associated protein family)